MQTKYAVFVFLFIASMHYAMGQQPVPTQEELKAMLEKLQRKNDSIQNAANRQIAESKKQAASERAVNTSVRTDRVLESHKLPPMDTAALKAIPRRTLSESQLKAFLDDVHSKLRTELPQGA